MKFITRIVLLLFVVISTIWSSCVKDKSIFEDNGNSGVVELNLPSRTSSVLYQTITSTIEVKDSVPVPVTVNYSGKGGAPKDVKVKLTFDSSALSAYNKAQSTSYVQVPSSYYSYSATVTIPKDSSSATDTIWLYTKKFDLSISYAIPLKISSTSSGTISGNYGTGIYILPIKSPWEGAYTATIDWDLSNTSLTSYAQYFPETITTSLSTYSPGVVKMASIGDLFGGYTYFKFKSDGTIGFYTSSTKITSINVLESSYDLDKLTFHIKVSFSHPSYGSFVLEETFQRTGDL